VVRVLRTFGVARVLRTFGVARVLGVGFWKDVKFPQNLTPNF
jgi:hypothetical protein